MYQGCPARQRTGKSRLNPTQPSYSSIVSAAIARQEPQPLQVTVSDVQHYALETTDETPELPSETHPEAELHTPENVVTELKAPVAQRKGDGERNQRSVDTVDRDEAPY
jgi:hypothetical protein